MEEQKNEAQEVLKYEDAIAEVQEILKKIETEDLPMEELTTKVSRAAFLLNFCKERLVKTEEEVSQIMSES